MDKNAALRTLKEYSAQLTRAQLLTLRGQILAGNVNGAMCGLTRIILGVKNQ